MTLKTDKDLNERKTYLTEKGYVDAESNKETLIRFSPMHKMDNACAFCVYNYEFKSAVIDIEDNLKEASWFILDYLIVHECAHASRDYYFGRLNPKDIDNNEAWYQNMLLHGNRFECFNKLPHKLIRSACLSIYEWITYNKGT
ncbi:MAG: hypothetical protein WCS21_10865 [Lachnospiraceae bacterium]